MSNTACVAIVDYGVGNLFSLQSSLAAIGVDAVVSGEPSVLAGAGRIILPGVGAFGDAMHKLRASGLAEVVRSEAAAGKPLLGICLGMQLLFDASLEFGRHEGLGLVPGLINSLEEALKASGFDYKVPHMGWNQLHFVQPNCPLLQNTNPNDYFYYVHSFYATECASSLMADSAYGVMIPGVVQRGNVYGTQFHPEKSSDAGLAMLRAFMAV